MRGRHLLLLSMTLAVAIPLRFASATVAVLFGAHGHQPSVIASPIAAAIVFEHAHGDGAAGDDAATADRDGHDPRHPHSSAHAIADVGGTPYRPAPSEPPALTLSVPFAPPAELPAEARRRTAIPAGRPPPSLATRSTVLLL